MYHFQKLVQLESELARLQESGLDLSTELKRADSTKSSEELHKQIIDLESQIDTLKTSEQLAWQKKNELEEELKNLKTLEDVSNVLTLRQLIVLYYLYRYCVIRILAQNSK